MPLRQRYLTSLMRKDVTTTKSKLITRADRERVLTIRKLARLGKRIIFAVPKSPTQEEERLISALMKSVPKGSIRLVKIDQKSMYSETWSRDLFAKIGKSRAINALKADDYSKRPSRHETRLFGDGGRIIDCGVVKGKRVVLVSESDHKTVHPTNGVKKTLEDETKMLQRRGFTVYTLPGFQYTPRKLQGNETQPNSFFHHIDVFVNHIAGTNVLLVDPDYYKQNHESFQRMSGFKIVTIPESEKDLYPANFLNLGKKEVFIEKNAKATIQKLKAEGVRVYTTPVGLQANRLNFGGVRCFVNEL